jgi:hypothetical protein
MLASEHRSFALDFFRKFKNNCLIDLMDLSISYPYSIGFGSSYFRYNCIICNSKLFKVGHCLAKTDESGNDIVYFHMVICLCNCDLYEIIILSDNILKANFYRNGIYLGYLVGGHSQKYNTDKVSLLDKIAYLLGQNNKTLQRTRYFSVYDHTDTFWGEIDLYGHGLQLIDRIYLHTSLNEMIPILVQQTEKPSIIAQYLFRKKYDITGNQSYIISHDSKTNIPHNILPFFFALSLFFRGYIVTSESELMND